ncbi:CBS domain-containing protein [Prauserella flavalba]|uniref:CBS domain-containing protein n=1 Tax=Prauserella flavalba TaxID=1477506 RepID=UPI0036E12DAC
MTAAPAPAPSTVRSVMTAKPYTVSPDAEFSEIARLLAAKRISGVPVVDPDGRPVGVVTEADLVSRGDHPGRRFRRRAPHGHARCARELMSAPVLAVDASDSVLTAARELSRTGVRRLCVVDGERLVGVLSRADLLRGFLRHDEEIRRDIVDDVFGLRLGIPAGSVGVAVERGVVTLLGQLPAKSDVELATTLTERVSGVVEVRNRLDYVWNDRQGREHRWIHV